MRYIIYRIGGLRGLVLGAIEMAIFGFAMAALALAFVAVVP